MRPKYGWRPDTPDHRDHLFKVGFGVVSTPLPPHVDLRSNCPAVYNQLDLGSCTANAIGAALEFDQIKQHATAGTDIFVPSRLFIYFNERLIEGTIEEDAGAEIRDGIKSVAKQGACPENLWPYDTRKYSIQPPASCYENAVLHRALQYQRLNSANINELKSCLAQGFPFVFGFTCYESFESEQVARTGVLSLPTSNEEPVGGHAVMCVGYDDPSQSFVIRNSWGPAWGQQGYFTIPYAYLTNESLAADFWTIRLVS